MVGMPGSQPVEVEMIADLACPWCYIGLHRLQRAGALRPERPVRVRWWPFLLNPHLPPEGMDRATYVRMKFGGDAAAARVYERIRAAGEEDGIAFAFDRMQTTPNTVLAQRLVLHAQEKGEVEPLLDRLFRALFVEGEDIGDPGVLTEIAIASGLERGEVEALLTADVAADEVQQGHARAERIGVRGVPVYVVDRQHAISGAQPPEVLAGLLDLAGVAEGVPA